MASAEKKVTKENDNTKERASEPVFSIGRKIGALVALLVVLTFGITQLLASELHMYLDVAADIENSSLLGQLVEDVTDRDEMVRIYSRGMEIYQGIPEEIRQQRFSEEYRSYYDELVTPKYQEVFDLLKTLCGRHGYRWIDLRVEDPDTGRIIYLLDTDPQGGNKYGVGYWEEEDEAVQIYSIFSSSDTEDDDADTGADTDEDTADGTDLISGFIDSIHNVIVMMSLPNSQFVTEVPYFDPYTGEVIGRIGFGADVAPYYQHRRVFALIFMICMIVILILILSVISLTIRHMISKPIKELSNAARNYVADKDKYQSGHYFENVRVKTNDEVRILRDSMSSMEKDIENYMNDLTVMIADREHTAAEMDVGAKIQMGMLPDELTDYNGIRDFDISAFIRPAKEVGGDFYDFFAIDDDHVAVVIADVSGKGVPAALFMILVKILIMTAGQTGMKPAGIVERVNRQLCEKNAEAMFATVWLGIYCVSEKKLEYVTAGHEYPVLYRASEDRFEMIKEEHDIALGVIPEYAFTEREILLNSGDKVYLYTDGIPEATSPDDEMYGLNRLTDCLNAHRSEKGNGLLDAVIKDVDDYVGDASQFDDMTSILLEVNDSPI